MLRRGQINVAIVTISVLIGLICRYLLRDQVTGDTFEFLLPWYEFYRSHEVSGLGRAFTEYTPFYRYLLLAAAQFHGLTEPWYLIKAISLVFEFGCAVLAARLVALDGRHRHAPAIAFAAVWLAPTVLFNGAAWGQSDSLWTFFILLSVLLFCRAKPGAGVIAFAAGFSVKAPASFLAPFILALVLRRTIHWAWLAAIPLTYFIIAAPAWLLGLPLSEIAMVYIKQGAKYERLSMNAANIWLFIPNRFYEVGATLGLAVAANAALAFSVLVSHSKRDFKIEHLVLLAALSLLLMPSVLPKMHDRYFYAFEVMAIVLACIKPRLAVIAIAAQLNGVLAYLAYYGIAADWLAVAAIGNIWILLELGLYAWRTLGKADSDEATAFSPMLFVGGLAAFWGVGLLA